MNQTNIIRCASCGTKNRVPAGKAGETAKCGKCGNVCRGAVDMAVESDSPASAEESDSDSGALKLFCKECVESTNSNPNMFIR